MIDDSSFIKKIKKEKNNDITRMLENEEKYEELARNARQLRKKIKNL